MLPITILRECSPSQERCRIRRFYKARTLYVRRARTSRDYLAALGIADVTLRQLARTVPQDGRLTALSICQRMDARVRSARAWGAGKLQKASTRPRRLR